MRKSHPHSAPSHAYRIVYGIGDMTGVMYVVALDDVDAVQVVKRTVMGEHAVEPVIYEVYQTN